MVKANYEIPKSVKESAQKGLDLRKEFKRGGTEIGLNRARQLINKTKISKVTLNKMKSYFARHKIDKNAKDFGNEKHPSNGYIAWLLWGGDEGESWINKLAL